MSASYWETTPTILEARVYPGDPSELYGVLKQMTAECIGVNGSVAGLSWKTDGDAVVISFPAGSISRGWSPKTQPHSPAPDPHRANYDGRYRCSLCGNLISLDGQAQWIHDEAGTTGEGGGS